MIYYFTGQPGAGKTTLGTELSRHIPNTIQIDGDDVRSIFKDVDYSEEGRRKNIQRAHDIALFLHKKDFDVIITLVSPYRDLRVKLREELPHDFVEFYVHTSDIRGREDYFVKNYEPPTSKYIDIDTTYKTIEESFRSVKIEVRRWLPE
jgi:adenylylsulfate kinase-like enzyme